MSKKYTLEDWKRFAEVYNDINSFPELSDVAVALGISYQTARNKTSIYRAMAKKDDSLVELIGRQGGVSAKTINKDKLTAEQHAQIRAQSLAGDITDLITRSHYPVINPEAIVVESFTTRKYDRDARARVSVESTPRTWMSDCLRVAPISDCRRKKFIFTGAQNDTDIHPIWNNLVTYAKHLGAKLVVGPGTYETQWWSENNPASRAYAEELTDYLCFGQMAIGENFVFCGEMNILPTASSPINDLVTYSRGRWAVFPHAKRQLKSVPSTDPDMQAHQVMTTGLCTKPKVIPRKAGIKSIFHYVAGATIVEFDKNGDIFCRQITAARDGSFYDLDCRVQSGKVTKMKRDGSFIRAITLPDIHQEKLGSVSRKMMSDIVDGLRPAEIFVHDLYDNEWGNHHHINDTAYEYELSYGGRNDVLENLKGSAAWLLFMQRPWMKINVVESNHDLALEKYVKEGRYRGDGKNMRLGLQLEDAYLEARERQRDAINAFKKPPKFSVLEHALKKLEPVKLAGVKWIYDGSSYVIDGIECGHHGFRGANGARGTVQGFAKMGRKMSIGDKHSPEINEGVYVSGVAELQHGYNKGPSGWAIALIVQYLDGKRTLITCQNGKWRA
jgi:hypothetical protein